MTRLPDAAWRHQPGLNKLLQALDVEQDMVRVVGGAVRDTLLGVPVKDVDCATRHLPEECMRRIKNAGFKVVPTGIKHGTVSAVLPEGTIEVTTLRRDIATDGRRATVAFTDVWQEDAARRDFTINAMSADPLTGEIFDYFDGFQDLEDRIVRFIGDPRTRIAEDHLRILRMFRFHARFGKGQPDAAALAACAERANDLMALSRERIADELLKLLACADPVPTVRIMFDHGIFRPIIPEIDASGIECLAHMVAREAQARLAADPVRRLGALLPAAPGLTVAIAQRLKLSRAITKRLELAASQNPAPPRALAYLFGLDAALDLTLRRDDDDTTMARSIAELDGWSRPNLPVRGGQLIEQGLVSGPVVAATLQAIERRWIGENFPDDERVAILVAEEVDQALCAIKKA